LLPITRRVYNMALDEFMARFFNLQCMLYQALGDARVPPTAAY